MKLSPEHITFFKRHKVPLWKILDASGMKPAIFKEALKDTDNLVAINSDSKSPCSNGHLLNIKERHGRCAECRVSGFSFIKPNKSGQTYVLGSLEGKILKVGYSYDIKDRYTKIIHDGYGGYSDWEIIYYGEYKEALNMENLLHSKLKQYGTTRSYSHYGKNVNCYELYECDYGKVKKEVENLNKEIGDKFLGGVFELENGEDKYNFVYNGEVLEDIQPLNYDNDYEYYLSKYGIKLS